MFFFLCNLFLYKFIYFSHYIPSAVSFTLSAHIRPKIYRLSSASAATSFIPSSLSSQKNCVFLVNRLTFTYFLNTSEQKN